MPPDPSPGSGGRMKSGLATRLIRRRQHENGAQPGFGVFQVQRTAMQAGHRLHQREAEAGARRAARSLTAVEPFGGLGPFFGRNARALVADDDPRADDLVPSGAMLGDKPYDTARGRELDGVVGQVGDGLLDQGGIAVGWQMSRRLHVDSHAPLLRDDSIKL